jgi:hypothetical protein
MLRTSHHYSPGCECDEITLPWIHYLSGNAEVLHEAHMLRRATTPPRALKCYVLVSTLSQFSSNLAWKDFSHL